MQQGDRLVLLIDTSQHAALVTPLRAALSTAGQLLTWRDDATLRDAVAQAHDLGASAWAIPGSPRALARVVQASTAPLPALLPLPTGRFNPLADALRTRDAPAATLARAVELCRKGPGLLRKPPTETSRALLRVASSLLPEALLGWTLGLGELVEAAQAPNREETLGGRAQALAGRLARALTDDAQAQRHARVALDDRPLADTLTLAAFSTLPQLAPGLSPFPAAPSDPRAFHVLWSQAHAALSALGAATARAPWLASALSASKLQRLEATKANLDLDSGFVLDGAVFPASEPYALGVRLGPRVRLLHF